MSQESGVGDTDRHESRVMDNDQPDDLVRRLRAAGCVFAEDEAALLSESAAGDELEALARRRVAGEPLETILGWVELSRERLTVVPGVFVPRQRTRLLADLARRAAEASAERRPVVVELCAGVAPVAALVARRLGREIEIHAADIDPTAAASAVQNLPATAAVHVGDLFDALPTSLHGRVDVLAANAPYVPTASVALMPPEARDHEPRRTLDGGADGLDLHRRITAQATEWLTPGGVLLVETSEQQAEATAALVTTAGLTARIERDDDLDATVVAGTRTGGWAEPPRR